MKKILITFIKLILFLIITLFLTVIIYRLNNMYYDNKYENIKIGTSRNYLIKQWGKPNKIYSYQDTNEVVYEYEKDWIGFYQYLFIFKKDNNLLSRKAKED